MSKRWIGGRVREAGGGVVIVVIDRDTESYPDIGAEVVMWVFREGETRPGEEPIGAVKPEVEALKARVEDLESINEGHVEDKAALQGLISELREKLAQQDEAKLGAAYQPQSPFHRLDAEEASLGLADTEKLMRELICRFKMNMYGEHTKMLDFERALVLAEMLGGLGATEREYRPVDKS